MKPIPIEKRKRAIELVEGGMPQAKVAKKLGFALASLKRFLAAHRAGATLEPRVSRPKAGRYLIEGENLAFLEELTKARPHITVEEICEELEPRLQGRPSVATVHRALARLGIRRVRPERREGVPADRPHNDAGRYLERHRQPGPRYPTDLTDAEWAVIEPLFAYEGPGRPRIYPVREMLNAMFYVVRSGCAWRMLPSDLPKWQAVYATFRRWTASGLFEEIHHTLRRMWREREGRTADPSAAIVDSQSVKTTEKGGLEVLTRARRSRDESVISR